MSPDPVLVLPFFWGESGWWQEGGEHLLPLRWYTKGLEGDGGVQQQQARRQQQQKKELHSPQPNNEGRQRPVVQHSFCGRAFRSFSCSSSSSSFDRIYRSVSLSCCTGSFPLSLRVVSILFLFVFFSVLLRPTLIVVLLFGSWN